MKRAFITGVTGQDGSYLSEFLLSKGYEVHGLLRRVSTSNTHRIDHIQQSANGQSRPAFYLHYGDLAAPESITRLVTEIQPDEIYNLGAQSHVHTSFDIPEYTADVTGVGSLRILEAIRNSNVKARYYQASTSELFGSAKPPQNEKTPFEPRSPYAVAKLYSYWMTKNYREGYSVFACNGILFNHESPRRGETFVTRKITRALAEIVAGTQNTLSLGNLDARRDWGYAPEYVEAMWKMVNRDEPDDFAIGTGEAHSIRDFLDESFGYLNLDWHEYVKIDPQFYRPTEVDYLMADTKKARTILEWEASVKFHELVRIMVDADLELVGLDSPGEGRRIIEKKFSTWHHWDAQVVSMKNR